MTKEGQVTWANPDIGQKCVSCKWYKKHPKPKLSNVLADGVCELVKHHTQKIGKPYNGRVAVACSKFEM